MGKRESQGLCSFVTVPSQYLRNLKFSEALKLVGMCKNNDSPNFIKFNEKL
jgi:hypothetical protein